MSKDATEFTEKGKGATVDRLKVHILWGEDLRVRRARKPGRCMNPYCAGYILAGDEYIEDPDADGLYAGGFGHLRICADCLGYEPLSRKCRAPLAGEIYRCQRIALHGGPHAVTREFARGGVPLTPADLDRIARAEV